MDSGKNSVAVHFNSPNCDEAAILTPILLCLRFLHSNRPDENLVTQSLHPIFNFTKANPPFCGLWFCWSDFSAGSMAYTFSSASTAGVSTWQACFCLGGYRIEKKKNCWKFYTPTCVFIRIIESAILKYCQTSKATVLGRNFFTAAWRGNRYGEISIREYLSEGIGDN